MADYRDVIINTQDNQEHTQLVKEIAVNCNNVLKDMILAFKDEMILSCCLEIVVIDERGNIEGGRGSGVKIEALSILWREFYNSLATGASEKVPAIRHDYKCRRVVSKDTMPKIFEELAHQEIIQCPKYVPNAWSPIQNELKRFKEFQTVDSLLSVYGAKKPTQKKVCKLLISNSSTDAQRKCFSHLKRFVKSLDDNLVSVFLQYVTGSNIIAIDSIEVAFSEESGKTRRPVAHTCAPLLVIPSTYQSYNELSEEFSNIF